MARMLENARAVAEWVLGLVLAAATLRDVFDTVVVPGPSRGWLRVSRRLVFAALPLWKRVRHRPIGVNFAPMLLGASFTVWMFLLVLGFGLMLHALAGSFTPRLEGLGSGMYMAAAAMSTIGFGVTDPHGLAALVAVLAGFCGLAVMTLAVTYLLEVQGNIGLRDTGVLRISTAAGHPPSALVLMERFAALDCREDIVETLRSGKDWCAAVLQSHASHPFLIYFRSAGTADGWPGALGTLADLALIVEHIVDEPRAYGPAVLMREGADRLAHGLTTLLRLPTESIAPDEAEMDELRRRLKAAGYQLRPLRDGLAFPDERARHAGAIDALSEHLGTARAPLVSARPE